MKKFYFILIITLCLFSCKESKTSITENEILWDNYGVPHIYATNDNDLYYMAAWAQMENHGDLILKLYGEARGVSAELWGDGFEINKDMHELGIIDQLEASYNHLEPKYQQLLTSFAQGINAYSKQHRASLDEKYLSVLPIRETDIIAHYFRVINYEFLIKLMTSPNERKAGSNAWALSGKKTSTGNAMLVANPHLWWSDLFLFHEQQFITNEQNMYGVTLVGSPSIIIGYNKHVSWTHTVNPIDNTDFYEVKKKGDTYYLDGEYLPFEEIAYSIKEKKEDGTIETHKMVRKKTKHGVVVKESEDQVIAMRFAQMNDFIPFLEQYDLMGKATNLEEFNNAMSLKQMPFLNTIYADTDGNIMHHFGGLVPKKNGDWEKWQNVVSGDSSTDLWTDYYDSNELPTAINPPGGYLQNANEPPFLNTLPSVLNAKDFASNITPKVESFSFRAQRSTRLVNENDSISFDQLVALKHNNQAEFALRIQDDLKKLTKVTNDSLVLAAVHTLTDWDASFDGESLGALLFMEFVNTWTAEKAKTSESIVSSFEKPWSVEMPTKTPDGFKDAEEMIGILKISAQNHLAKYSELAVPYGKHYKLQMGDKVYPATGGPQSLGVFRILSAIPNPENENDFTGIFGDTFVLVLEMGEKVRAKGLLTYGNSSNPKSPHYGDQLELFSKNQLRDIWFDRESQLKNLKLIEYKNDM